MKNKGIKLLVCLLLTVMILSSCGAQDANQATDNNSDASQTTGKELIELGDKYTDILQAQKPSENQPTATIKTTMGDISIMFFPEQAPKAVENFLTHATEGYYDGVIFHRVIEGFMIQGGDPDGTGMGGESIWGKAFEDEFSLDVWNFRGALSMANSGKNTNGSQFFIVQSKELGVSRDVLKKANFPEEVINAYEEVGGTPHLDHIHTVFGHVYEGMDVVDAIAAAETDSPNTNKPVKDIVIESIEVRNWNK